MNAPGDSALIVVLLAVFVACSAYAAGRVHQRWQAAKDREEAYRDGYENGTSNVFSTAVRMLGPKRSVRAAAPVTTASKSDPAQAPEISAPNAPSAAPQKPEKSDSSRPTTGLPALGFPAPQPPPRYAISEPSAVGGVIYQQLRNPRTADGKPPLMGERPTMPPLPHPRTATRPAPHPGVADHSIPTAPHPSEADRSDPAVPPVPHRSMADRPHPTVPPLPHPRVADRPRMAAASEPANLDELSHPEQPKLIKVREGAGGRVDGDGRSREGAGGHVDGDGRSREGAGERIEGGGGNREGASGRVDGDGRSRAGAGERLERGGGSPEGGARERGDAETPARAAVPVRRRRGGHRAKQPEDETTVNQAVEAQPDVPAGRHTVPDELVRATTYRLPPDRVFRAKVRDGTPLPDEPTTRLPSVPKPRDES